MNFFEVFCGPPRRGLGGHARAPSNGPSYALDCSRCFLHCAWKDIRGH